MCTVIMPIKGLKIELLCLATVTDVSHHQITVVYINKVKYGTNKMRKKDISQETTFIEW